MKRREKAAAANICIHTGFRLSLLEEEEEDQFFLKDKATFSRGGDFALLIDFPTTANKQTAFIAR